MKDIFTRIRNRILVRSIYDDMFEPHTLASWVCTRCGKEAGLPGSRLKFWSGGECMYKSPRVHLVMFAFRVFLPVYIVTTVPFFFAAMITNKELDKHAK